MKARSSVYVIKKKKQCLVVSRLRAHFVFARIGHARYITLRALKVRCVERNFSSPVYKSLQKIYYHSLQSGKYLPFINQPLRIMSYSTFFIISITPSLRDPHTHYLRKKQSMKKLDLLCLCESVITILQSENKYKDLHAIQQI